jgi:hypothetical protein
MSYNNYPYLFKKIWTFLSCLHKYDNHVPKDIRMLLIKYYIKNEIKEQLDQYYESACIYNDSDNDNDNAIHSLTNDSDSNYDLSDMQASFLIFLRLLNDLNFEDIYDLKSEGYKHITDINDDIRFLSNCPPLYSIAYKLLKLKIRKIRKDLAREKEKEKEKENENWLLREMQWLKRKQNWFNVPELFDATICIMYQKQKQKNDIRIFKYKIKMVEESKHKTETDLLNLARCKEELALLQNKQLLY